MDSVFRTEEEFKGRKKPSVFDEWRNRPEKLRVNRRQTMVVIEKYVS
jgi:hypothetical protein